MSADLSNPCVDEEQFPPLPPGCLWCVVGDAPRRGGQRYWLCRCVCGRMREVNDYALVRGKTLSCGCHGRIRTVETPKLPKVQTLKRMYYVEYTTWCTMWSRCSRPTANGFKHYGGKGVTVCDRWRTFDSFLADMGPRPSAKHTLDRIDSTGNYCPENCRWATWSTQTRNKSNNHYVTFNGRTLIVADWARELGISPQSLQKRLKKWSRERALSLPRTIGK